MMLLVGARATAFWFGSLARETADWDVWFDEAAFAAWARSRQLEAVLEQGSDGRRSARIETQEGGLNAIIAPAGGSEAAFAASLADAPRCASGPCPEALVASPAALALIKRSHLHDPDGWHKHIADYHFLKGLAGEDLAAEGLQACGQLRRQEWLGRHPEARLPIGMKVPNEAFFASSRIDRIRVHEHDALHRATCFGEQPMYLSLKDDPDLAYVPSHRFDRLHRREQIRVVLEEVFVIALERVIIPSLELGRPFDPHRAMHYALRRICTDMAAGWFREFALEAFPEIAACDWDFLGRYQAAVASGRLQRRDGLPDGDVWRDGLARHLDEIDQKNARAGIEWLS